MPNARIGQVLGRETILECTITAFPHAVNYWEKDGKRINTFGKHRVEAYDEGDHTLTLSLRIHSIQVGISKKKALRTDTRVSPKIPIPKSSSIATPTRGSSKWYQSPPSSMRRSNLCVCVWGGGGGDKS